MTVKAKYTKTYGIQKKIVLRTNLYQLLPNLKKVEDLKSAADSYTLRDLKECDLKPRRRKEIIKISVMENEIKNGKMVSVKH